MAPSPADDALSNNSSRRRRHPTNDAIAAAEAAALSINGHLTTDSEIRHQNGHDNHITSPSKSSTAKRRNNNNSATAPSLFTNGSSSAPKRFKVNQILLMLLLCPLMILLLAVTSSSRHSHVVAETKPVKDGGFIYHLPQHDHHHAIPPIVIFTYHTNLLSTRTEQLTDEEDRALSSNVQHIVALHPESTIRFLNDEDCKSSIKATLGPDTKLVQYFNDESHGMYKADICRGAALYETGGLYFDIDIEARMSLWEVIRPRTEFVTTLVHKDSNHRGGFFQAFIGVTPRHPVMKRYVELFVEYYEGKVKVNGPLGVYFLRMAYDELVSHNEEKKQYTELWKEIRYHEKLFPGLKEPPTGKRRACQMLVVALPLKSKKKKEELKIPFYSHARGSRMCGGKDTNKTGRL